MTSPRRFGALVAHLSTALVVGAASLWTLPVAYAGSEGRLRVQTLETVAGGEGLFDQGRLAPGSTLAARVVVRHDHGAGARLSLKVADLVEDENGCLPPERRHPGEECDADGGELGSWLRLDARVGTQTTSLGRLGDLGEPTVLVDSLPPGESVEVELRLALDVDAGNDTMTDRVSFDLVWVAESEHGTSKHAHDGTAVGGGHAGSIGAGLPPWVVPLAVLKFLPRLVAHARRATLWTSG